MRVLLSKRTANAPFKYNMIAVAILMFIVATLDVALALRLNLEAFIYFQGPGGADAAFADISNWVNVMKTADYAAQTAIGDGMLVHSFRFLRSCSLILSQLYRCYMVYNRRWIIIVIPAIIWAATTGKWVSCRVPPFSQQFTVCEAFTIEVEATLRQNAFLNVKNLTPFITSTLSLTLVFNIVTTCLSSNYGPGESCRLSRLFFSAMIVLKIYSVNQNSAPLQSRSTYGSTTKATRLGRVMRIVIESGLMYTISVVIFFAVFLSDNNAEYAVADCVGPSTAAIVFTYRCIFSLHFLTGGPNNRELFELALV